VKRVLKQNGYFITQQVGGKNCIELKEVGLKIIEKYEDFPKLRFYDVDAIIYYLKTVPWQIPDFSVDKYYNSLKKVHNKIQERGFIDIKEHRFMIFARK